MTWYGQLFGENLNDVTMTSSSIRFLWNLTTNWPNDIPNFILIEHKRAEMNEWSGYLYTAFHQVSDPVHSTYHRLTDRLSTWVEQSKDTCSCVDFLFSHHHLFGLNQLFFFLYHSYSYFLLPTYILLYLYGAWWLSVCDWHSLNTNYYGTNFGGVPGSLNSVPDRMHVWPE